MELHFYHSPNEPFFFSSVNKVNKMLKNKIMKKLFLTLMAVVATSIASFAQISLSDAYTGLVNLPGSVEKKIDKVPLCNNVAITDLQTVTYKGKAHAQEFIYTYESLPVVNQLIGANNQNEMACIFTEPSETGIYNILILVGEKGGPYIAAYGQTTPDGLELLRNCEVAMHGDQLMMNVVPLINVYEMVSVTETY